MFPNSLSAEAIKKLIENGSLSEVFEQLDKLQDKMGASIQNYNELKKEFVSGQSHVSIIKERLRVLLSFIFKEPSLLVPKFLSPIPFRSDLFMGREKDLKEIHQRLFQESPKEAIHPNTSLLLLINGQGGIGKTTLATHYFYSFQKEYEHLAWLLVEPNLKETLLRLAPLLQLRFDEKMPDSERLQTVFQKLKTLAAPSLLILDNANDPEDLEEVYYALRECPNLHILLTSRITDFEAADTFFINALPKDIALEIFQEYYNKTFSESEAILFENIYDALEGNTLVLEVLAKKLKSINRFKEKYSLENLFQDLNEKGVLQVMGQKEIKVAWQQKGKKLQQAGPEAILLAMYDLSTLDTDEKQILSNLAVLPAEDIPFTTLERLLGLENLEESLEKLIQKGWLEEKEQEEESHIKISPVTQAIVQKKNQSQLWEDCQELIDNLVDELEQDNLHHQNYQPATQHVRYGELILDTFKEAVNYHLALLTERIGYYYQIIGNLNKAFQSYEICRDISQKLVKNKSEEPYHKNELAISYSKLGEISFSLGNLEEAKTFFEQYKQLEQELYEEFPQNIKFKSSLAISYAKLGEISFSLGNLEEAKTFFEQYKQLEQELYEEFPQNIEFKSSLAISYSKLGEISFSLGNLEEAKTFFEQSKQLEQELYKAFPQNVEFKNNLALSYQWLGWFLEQKLGEMAKARKNYLESQKLLIELTNAFPTYVSFRQNLDWVEEKLANYKK